jgi:hypothetical protein
MRRWSDELIEDREFEVGGEIFEWIYPNWEIGAKLFNEELNPVPSENGGEPARFDWVQNTKKAVDGVPMFLHPKNDSAKRWKALCARKEDAVPRHQISQIYNWLVQVTGNLPTTPPSSELSADGDGETEAVSSDVSPSTEATSTA